MAIGSVEEVFTEMGLDGDELRRRFTWRVGPSPGLQAYEPTPVAGLPSDVRSVAAGHYHSLAVTSSGQLWAWGRNSEFQLARGLKSPRDMWSIPQRVQGLDNVQVVSAFASGVISAVIVEDGSLWAWGSSKRGQLGLGKDICKSVTPARVEALVGEFIVKVSFGWGHALALSDSGKLFGWGYHADGRLGRVGKAFEVSPLDSVVDKIKAPALHRDAFAIANDLVLEAMEKEKDMLIIWEPTLIEEVDDTQVVDIACGLDHSLVLLRDGTLLSGGSDVYGQLGRSNKDLGLHPVNTSFRFMKVACGVGHSLAICEENNSIVSWGWNANGQLGRRGEEDVPNVIESNSISGSLDGGKVLTISGGRAHSVAVTAEDNVWGWGCGRDGRLGTGSSIDEPEPVIVEIESLEGGQVLQSVAGFDHTLVLVGE